MDFEDYKTSSDGEKMLAKLKSRLLARDFDLSDFKDETLYEEIESAIEAVNNRRHFISTPEILFEPKYNTIVLRLAVHSISKYGAEGESSHSENGIVRIYERGAEYPESILAYIVPLAKVSNI